MPTKIGSHCGDEALERYAMGDLPESLAAGVEEHILLCEACQVRLEQAEQFLSVARVSCVETRRELRYPARKGMSLAWLLGGSRGLFAGALATLAMMIAIPLVREQSHKPGLTSDVELRMARGAGEEMSAHAAPGKLILHADVTELRQMPVYVLQLVSGSGAEIWKGSVPAVNQRIDQTLPTPVQAGRYWVRLYTSDGDKLLREFGLEVR